MLKDVVLSVLVGLLLCAACAFGADETNLLTNASFTDVSAQGNPVGWRGSGDPVTVTSADLATGRTSAVSITIQTQASGLGEFLQRVPAKPNWNYRVAGFVRGPTPGLGLVQVKFYHQKKEVGRFDIGKNAGMDWTALEREFTTPREVDAIEILCRYDRGAASQGKTVEFAGLKLVSLGERIFVAPKPGEPSAVTTFESIGVTLPYEGDPSDQVRCTVRYRLKGASAWQHGLDLVHRPTEKCFRGSILNVQPGSEYEIECDLIDTGYAAGAPITSRTLAVRTWDEDVPIARVVRLPAGVSEKPLVINDVGSPEGWILYTSAEDGASTIDVGTAAPSAVEINGAAYVIFENVTVRGGAVRGVNVTNSHHIRIRRCDIAGWGDPGTPRDDLKQGRYVNAQGKVIDWQAGVHVGAGASRVVVEENFIHGPRGTANSWAYGHPSGPQAVILGMTEGNNVVRNNELIGSEKHWWNDAIESLFNERVQGGPYRDTDISGNVIAFANDDGTELDGGQINVRFFNNWVQWAFCGISCAPNMAGPSYVYRNLFVMTGEERGMTNFGFKMSGDRYPAPGRTFLLHNTMISTNAGLSTGHMGLGAAPITARNNAYLSGELRLRGTIAGNYDLDYDLIQPGTLTPSDAPGQQVHAVVGRPTFVAQEAGDYRLADASPGIDAAVRLPGVNDIFAGAAPDIGAFEQGQAEALFPRRRRAISALPLMNHLQTGGGREPTRAMIDLKIPADTGTTWTAHVNAPWLRCEPTSGPVGDQRVTILPADTHDLPPGDYRGAVTFRTDKGYCRTVLVTLEVKPAEPFEVVFEAEAGERAGGFVVIDDPAASGGRCLQTPADFRHQTAPEVGVSFSFEVPVDGVYYVQARLRVPGPEADTHDSLFVAMDDQPRQPWHLQHLGSADYHWVRVNTLKNPGSATAFHLTKGRHTFHIHPRETLTRVDAVRIRNTPSLAEANAQPSR